MQALKSHLPAMGPLYMGIDIGTSSTKGVLINGQGNIVADSVIRHGVSTPAPHYVEQDAEMVWWGELTQVSRRLLKTVGKPATVGAIAVSGIGPCVLPVDAFGKALRPAILYGVDTRSGEEAEELSSEYAPKGIKVGFDSQ